MEVLTYSSTKSSILLLGRTSHLARGDRVPIHLLTKSSILSRAQGIPSSYDSRRGNPRAASLRRRLYSTLSVRLPVGETPSALPSSGNHPAPPPPHTHPHTHAHTHTRTRTRSLFGPRSRWGHAHGWATHCWATLTVGAAFNPESLRTQTRGGIFQQAPCTSICF